MMVSSSITTQDSKFSISVVVPVYNADKFLGPCLDSIVGQRFRDLEIICVNDASPDDCTNILTNFASKDRRVNIVSHARNLGLSAARNSGMARARGKYVIFVDSDDFLSSPDALSILFDRAESDGADEVIGGIVKWDERTGVEYLDWHGNYLADDVRARRLVELPELRANVIAVNKLIRRQLLSDNKISFNPAIRKHEDNPFSLKVHATSNRISVVTTTTYTYRQSQAASITTTNKKSDAYFRVLYCKEIFEYIERSTDAEVLRAMYYPMYVTQLILAADLYESYPTNTFQHSTFISQWCKTLSIAEANAPYIGKRQRQILQKARAGKSGSAWSDAVEFGRNQREITREAAYNTADWATVLENELEELEAKRNLLEAARSRIAEIHDSRSWRATRLYRNVATLLRR